MDIVIFRETDTNDYHALLDNDTLALVDISFLYSSNSANGKSITLCATPRKMTASSLITTIFPCRTFLLWMIVMKRAHIQKSQRFGTFCKGGSRDKVINDYFPMIIGDFSYYYNIKQLNLTSQFLFEATMSSIFKQSHIKM